MTRAETRISVEGTKEDCFSSAAKEKREHLSTWKVGSKRGQSQKMGGGDVSGYEMYTMRVVWEERGVYAWTN